MNNQNLEIGKWYLISEYGYSEGIRAKLVDQVGDFLKMSFFWGSPFRTVQTVDRNKIVGECTKPKAWFSN